MLAYSYFKTTVFLGEIASGVAQAVFLTGPVLRWLTQALLRGI